MVSQQKRGTNFTLEPDSIEEAPIADNLRQSQDRSDIVTNSGELKKLIRKVLSDNGLRLYSVCETGGFNYPRIKQWLNSKKPRTGGDKVGQTEIISFCNVLGISVRVTLVVSSVAFADDLKYVKRRAKIATKNSVYDKFIENGEPTGQEKETDIDD